MCGVFYEFVLGAGGDLTTLIRLLLASVCILEQAGNFKSSLKNSALSEKNLISLTECRNRPWLSNIIKRLEFCFDLF